jgi:hypothetical protein
MVTMIGRQALAGYADGAVNLGRLGRCRTGELRHRHQHRPSHHVAVLLIASS